MAQIVFFDNSIARALISNPKNWYLVNNTFKESIRPLYSYYSFLEYIGVTKKRFKEPNSALFKFDNITTIQQAQNEREIIGNLCEQYFDEAVNNLKGQLSIPHNIDMFKDKIQKQSQRTSTDAEIVATHLAWDYFCNVLPNGMPVILLRKAQIHVWMQLYQLNIVMPFGKIIDDFAPQLLKTPLTKNSLFKGYGDMVDAEAITYLIAGIIDKNNLCEPVNFFTTDSQINIRERIQLAENSLLMIERYANKILNRSFGKVYYCDLDETDNLKIISRESPSIPILL